MPAVVTVLGDLIDDAAVGNAIADGVKRLRTALVVSYGSTAVVIGIEHWGGKDSLPQWEVDSLPDVPAHRQVSLSDAVTSVIFIAKTGATRPPAFPVVGGGIRGCGHSGAEPRSPVVLASRPPWNPCRV